MRRCRQRFAGERCILVRDHPGFGHQFGKGTRVLTIDDPARPVIRPNWRHDPYPVYERPDWEAFVGVLALAASAIVAALLIIWAFHRGGAS